MKYENKAIATKGGFCHIRKRTIVEIVTFIQSHLKYDTVSQLCSALKFPRSTYYKGLVSVPSNRQKEYDTFAREVKEAYIESKQQYGAVKIWHSLNDQRDCLQSKTGAAPYGSSETAFRCGKEIQASCQPRSRPR